jgi:hypothetical protein
MGIARPPGCSRCDDHRRRDGLAPAPRTARRFTIARRAAPETCCWSPFILGPFLARPMTTANEATSNTGTRCINPVSSAASRISLRISSDNLADVATAVYEPRTARRFTIARRAVPEVCCWSTFILRPFLARPMTTATHTGRQSSASRAYLERYANWSSSALNSFRSRTSKTSMK